MTCTIASTWMRTRTYRFRVPRPKAAAMMMGTQPGVRMDVALERALDMQRDNRRREEADRTKGAI
jgi:hypothetical protein